MPDRFPDEVRDDLISVCRTTTGDTLRSITCFTTSDHDQIYLRSDLEQDAEIERFVNNERLGFTSQATYGDSELGDYEFTIRTFEFGYVMRVIVGDHGVYVTTDSMHMDEFEELATAIENVLQDHAS